MIAPLGINVNLVPRYHQSTNGAIERQHRTLKESIKASLVEMGDLHKEKWMSQLPLTLLGRRVSLQPDLGCSSADLVLGGPPVLPGVVVPDTLRILCYYIKPKPGFSCPNNTHSELVSATISFLSSVDSVQLISCFTPRIYQILKC